MDDGLYIRGMERLVEVVQELSAVRSLDETTALVRREARALAGADGATFVLRDGALCHYADEDAISPLWKGQRFPMSSCISGWVMTHRETVVLDDIYADGRIPHDAYRPTFVKSMAMVPIRRRAPIGAIGCYWDKIHRPDPRAIRLVEALANTVSVTLENLKLFDDATQSHKLFAAFIDKAPFAASIRDTRGVIRYANDKMAEIFRARPAAIIGRNAVEVSPEESVRRNVSRALADDLEVLRTGKPSDLTYMMVKEDGTDQHWWATKFPLPDGETIGTITIDVTTRVRAEQEREQAQTQLQHAYKMSALGEMAGNIAHEINNPLSIIIGKARQLQEVLDGKGGGPATAKAFAGQIAATAERAVKIVNGLQAISRYGARDPFKSITLASLVDGSAALAAGRFHHSGIKLEIIPIAPSIKLEGRASELSQVLVNLFNNAIDAVSGLAEKWVRIEAVAEAAWVTLAVTDSGPGIPQSLHKKIMNPFFTTKDVGKGTGLGLSISKDIIEAHGGTLSIDCANVHTSFLIRLPLNQSPP